MRNYAHELKYVAIVSNILCIAGFYWASVLYDKPFKAKKVHRLTVALGVNMVVYLVYFLYCTVSYLFEGRYVLSLGSAFFLTNMFLIAYLGNNYDKAKLYFNIQLFFFLISLCTIILAV